MGLAVNTQNILKQLYSNSEELVKTSEETSGVLGKIYKLQVEANKDRDAAAEKAKRDARRKMRDDKRDDLDTQKKVEKKEKEEKKQGKTFMEKLKEGLMGLLNGIGPIVTGALGGLIPAITGALGALAAPLGALLLGALKVAAIAAAGVLAAKTISSIRNQWTQFTSDQAQTADGTAFNTQDVAEFQRDLMAQNHTDPDVKDDPAKIESNNRRIQTLETIKKKMEVSKSLSDQIKRQKKNIAGLEKSIKELKRGVTGGRLGIGTGYKQKEQTLKDAKSRLSDLEINKVQNQKMITNLWQTLGIADKDLLQKQIKTGRRGMDQLPEGYNRDDFEDRDATGHLYHSWGHTQYNDQPRQQLQVGGQVGAFTVPGSGSGDQFPIDLPEGSFVLNRTASNALRQGLQRGGKTNMVPTLLEPGERVFLPGQWEGTGIAQLNQAVSRFQTGGVVEADHPDTGSGWSVGTDSHGRPSVFTKEAATALAKAIKASNGAVKTSDITSSKRSVAKNRAVGGVPNSNHLYGNAVDIHGTSKAWLKANGMDYGWKNLVYSGHDGHFDFVGGSTPIKEVNEGGNEQTADQENNNQGGKDIDQQAAGDITGLDYVKNFGTYINTLAEGLGGIFGDLFGGLLGGKKGKGGNRMDTPGMTNFLGTSATSTGSAIAPTADAIIPEYEEGKSYKTGDKVYKNGGLRVFDGFGWAEVKPVTGMRVQRGDGVRIFDGMGWAEYNGPTPTAAGGEFSEGAIIAALDRAGVTDKTERAMFLAQMAHESGGFRYSEEIASGEDYEGRQDLGNTQPGDGKRYKGRGYIQITGRANYRKYGKIVGHDLENNPQLASDPNIAADVALAYWNDRVDRSAARAGDINTVTYNINGGYNGLDDRISRFETYKQKGLQTGGRVNMGRAQSKLDMRMHEAQNKYNAEMAHSGSNAPIVITKSSGGGVNYVSKNPSPTRQAPELPEDCSAAFAADYTYNISLGGY